MCKMVKRRAKLNLAAYAVGVIALLFALSACGFTPQGDLIRDVVKQGTQKAGDAGLRNAEWFLCEAAPVGAVKRRYGSANAAETYAKLCDRGAAGNIIKPWPKVITPEPKLIERGG